MKEDQMKDPLTSYGDHESLRENDFADLIKNRQALDAELKELNKKKKELNDSIPGLMATVDVKSVFCNGWKVTMTETSRRTLKKDKLLTLGVSPEVIDNATDETFFTQLRVSEVKG